MILAVVSRSLLARSWVSRLERAAGPAAPAARRSEVGARSETAGDVLARAAMIMDLEAVGNVGTKL